MSILYIEYSMKIDSIEAGQIISMLTPLNTYWKYVVSSVTGNYRNSDSHNEDCSNIKKIFTARTTKGKAVP